MEKALKNASPILFIIVLIGFSIWTNKQVHKEIEDIEAHGVKAHAVVVDTHYAKGQSMDIEFVYQSKRHHIAFARTSKFEVKRGDSVSILFLPSQPDGNILLEDRFFTVPRKSYFGWLDGH
jgi:hypothetical protein